MGYIYHFQPYPGAAETPTEDYNFGSSGYVVYFMANLMMKRFPSLMPLQFTMDNYFTSFQLLQALKHSLSVTATGAIRTSHISNFPIDVSDLSKKERGSCDYRYVL